MVAFKLLVFFDKRVHPTVSVRQETVKLDWQWKRKNAY